MAGKCHDNVIYRKPFLGVSSGACDRQAQRTVVNVGEVARNVIAKPWNRFEETGRGGLVVWARISTGGRSKLYIIRTGNWMAQRHEYEILGPHVTPYAAAIRNSLPLNAGQRQASY
ncbi:hypothetical protein TNCV_2656501 [Trichonephila clavipes]|nr:hypothetical protein TNCV_2656501 [Trichonephila clavipes]